MVCKTFHKGKYYVTFKRGFEDSKKNITVTVDKMFECDTLKIALSDDDDPTFLCVLLVTRSDYEDLKKQQGLLIDFDNFPAQLVRLLQQCAANNMFLIIQQSNPLQYYFEVVEHNEFKRLVHLSLKTSPASDTDIKAHMAETILNLKKMLASVKSSASSTEVILNDKCVNLERKVHDLSVAINKMEDEKIRRENDYQEALRQEKERIAQEKLQWQRNLELNTKTQQAATQEIVLKKDKQIDELNSVCKQLKDSIGMLETQVSEKSQRLHLLETEVQKTHIEVATLNAKNTSLERELNEKDKNYNKLNSKCTNLEQTIRDNTITIKELNNSLQLIRNEKANLEDRLALSESLSKKSNEAAHSASEQLLKANQIISKQNSDLMEMKEKLLCRTAIALEQEKVIEKNTKEIEDLKLDVSRAKENMEALKTELESLKQKCDTTEKALKDRDDTIKNNNLVIQWLHKKMENTCPSDDVIQDNSNETPRCPQSQHYFLSRNSSKQTNASEESINFYATTSKLSNLEDSADADNEIKTGLDPKYLKPAADDNKAKCKDSKKISSTSDRNQKGKENKITDLPRVDYREKKTARTYRATPVSAYFH